MKRLQSSVASSPSTHAACKPLAPLTPPITRRSRLRSHAHWLSPLASSLCLAAGHCAVADADAERRGAVVATERAAHAEREREPGKDSPRRSQAPGAPTFGRGVDFVVHAPWRRALSSSSCSRQWLPLLLS
eukprot:6186507-Pleurochrysis_carterae.AAC.2